MKITVIGAGSRGAALTLHSTHHNNEVALWTRSPDQIHILQANRENGRGLPGFPSPEPLIVYADLDEALKGSQLALIVTFIAGLRSSAELLKQHNAVDIPVLTTCKGFEQNTSLLTFQVLKEVLPNNKKVGVLSGPSFARELAAQLPCAVVLASGDKEWVKETTAQLDTNVIHLYDSTDVIGVTVGGAVKNVMAIATDLPDSLEYSLNARAALITCGLTKITRLAIAIGAQPKTMTGSAGIGDLILTCTGTLSRNRRIGLGLAEGGELYQVLVETGHVSEGISTIEEVFNTTAKYRIDMSTTQTLPQLIREEMTPQQVIERLMEQSARFE